MENEIFYDKIKKLGKSYYITIPSKLIIFAGLKKNEILKVMIQKSDLERIDIKNEVLCKKL